MTEAGPVLARIAERAMVEAGFVAHPPPRAEAEAAAVRAAPDAAGARDLRALPWTSIDNVESRDLDQIEAVENVAGGMKLYVGVADVEHAAVYGGAVDQYAGGNTTSVYTGARTFPMLPESLSFDRTSLLAQAERLAVVVETVIAPDGRMSSGAVYAARVINQAKLDYPSVSAWLDGRAAAPAGLAGRPELLEQLRRQDALAASLAAARRRLGALDLDTHEVDVVVDARGAVTELTPHSQDRAGAIIEELMIASNTALALELDRRGLPSIRRVVKEPERWEKIAAYAAGFSVKLPAAPSAPALSQFADQMRREQAARFGEISVALVKLIGRGEYEAHRPGQDETGHFGLAAEAYAHGTAPNRRYVDLVAQRIVKASHAYSFDELAAVAARCTEREIAAKKVERRVRKSAGALLLQGSVGRTFDAVVTGAGPKGTYARLFDPHVEGKVVRGEKGLKVGDRARVALVEADVERGYIDFAAAS